MGSILLGACNSPQKQEGQKNLLTREQQSIYMLTGSYASPEEEGIKIYRFNEDTGEVTYLSGLKGISNPSYLIPSVNGERIYAVGEDEGETSTANAIRFDKEQGLMTLLNSQRTGGGAPCYITLNPSGKFVITANYMGGSITIFPLNQDGRLMPNSRLISFTGHGPDKERQSQAHLHCVEFTPEHKYMLANDLGTDQIHIFPISATVTEGISHTLLDEAKEYQIKVEPGSGPRHICFHPNQKFAYLINELSGKITVFSYDQGKLKNLQSIECDTIGARGSGDIHISPDGRFVYASNRLQADGIAIFSVDPEKGTLTKAGYQTTDIHPRSFIITPNGLYLLVACRDSNTIQIFRRNMNTGLLTNTGKSIKTNKPVCLKFIN